MTSHRRSFRSAALILCLALGVADGALARVDDASAAMARAIAAEAALEYEQARELWLEVIARDDLTEEQRLEANMRAGSVARILDRDVEARSHFVNVLGQRPDYQLPLTTSPKVRNFFELIRQELRSSGAIGTPRPLAPVSRAAAGPVADPADGGTNLPGPLVWAGAGTVALGLVAAALGVTAGALSNSAHQEALATDVQVERMDRYRTRDTLVLAANLGYGGATLLALVGLSLTGVGLLPEGG